MLSGLNDANVRSGNAFMMNLKEYIQENLYPHRRGIMGTVIFHLLAAIFLLSMQISRIEKIPSAMEIVVEPPTLEEVQKVLEEQEKKEEILKKTSSEAVEEMLRSIAVNENVPKQKSSKGRDEAKVQEYIDEVMSELENGEARGRYKAQRDKNFHKDSLQNARDRKERELDSLKSTIYSGKSSVSYNLKDRTARVLPIPVFKCEYGGTVVVTIAVDRKGVVQKAEVVKERSLADDCLWDVAADAAKRSLFSVKTDAPELQMGMVTYHFVKQ